MSSAGNRFIFRGQRNADWDIRASILRPGVNASDATTRAKIFALVLEDVWRPDHFAFNQNIQFNVGQESYLAAAQHYGIPTHLVDFTTDPDVAVFFATHNTMPDEDNTASVYFITLNEALSKGCEIILPPPFAERLYLQKGLFLKMSEPLDKEKFFLGEVRFPTRRTSGNQSIPPFQIMRRGENHVDILVDKLGFIDVVKKISSSDITDQNLDELHDWAVDFIFKHLEAEPSDPLILWAQYADAFEEMLYSLAMFEENGQEAIVKQVLEYIVRRNRAAAKGVSAVYHTVLSADLSNRFSAHQKQAQEIIAREIDCILSDDP
jgi:hypothetical protein